MAFAGMILKLKRTPAIFLLGFMGCGKSTVGRLLSDELGWSFFDLDEEIEKAAGRPISEIFDTLGEAEFRRMESIALRERVSAVLKGRPQVISLGGGAFTIAENRHTASENGVTIWLDTPLNVIEQRIASETHRPLARDREKMRELYLNRRESYAAADYCVETGDHNAAEIVRLIGQLPIFVP